MTTEIILRIKTALRKTFRTVLVLLALSLGWFLTMATVMIVTEAAPAALAIVPDITILNATSEDIKLIRGNAHILILTSKKSGYVSELYQAGAWIVLPALRNGCLDRKAFSNVITVKYPLNKK